MEGGTRGLGAEEVPDGVLAFNLALEIDQGETVGDLFLLDKESVIHTDLKRSQLIGLKNELTSAIR